MTPAELDKLEEWAKLPEHARGGRHIQVTPDELLDLVRLARSALTSTFRGPASVVISRPIFPGDTSGKAVVAAVHPVPVGGDVTIGPAVDPPRGWTLVDVAGQSTGSLDQLRDLGYRDPIMHIVPQPATMPDPRLDGRDPGPAYPPLPPITISEVRPKQTKVSITVTVQTGLLVAMPDAFELGEHETLSDLLGRVHAAVEGWMPKPEPPSMLIVMAGASNADAEPAPTPATWSGPKTFGTCTHDDEDSIERGPDLAFPNITVPIPSDICTLCGSWRLIGRGETGNWMPFERLVEYEQRGETRDPRRP